MTDNKFLTEDEIVADILQNMSKDDVRSWLAVNENQLALAHHSTGQWIRNHYKLWHEDNPHTKFGNSYVDKEGVASHENHADQLSSRIINRIWHTVHETPKKDSR